MLVALVPAYNEAKHIGSVVRNLFQHVDEVVVIDDGSGDQTAVQARAAGATVLRHRLNRGQGASLQTGHEYAKRCRASYVLHFDGDGQFSVDDIAPALAYIQKQQADILFGSRFLGTASDIPWFKRYVILPIARWVDWMFGAVRLSDAHNGFRILNRRAIETITITQDTMAHATEIPQQVRRHSLRYVEFPVKVMYREYGQGLSGGIKVMKDLIMGLFVHNK